MSAVSAASEALDRLVFGVGHGFFDHREAASFSAASNASARSIRDRCDRYQGATENAFGMWRIALTPPSSLTKTSPPAVATVPPAWMGAFARGEILSEDLQAAMIADVAATRALGARVGYGLGIEEVLLDGRRALGHSGRFLGFRNTVLYVPEVGVSIAVLTNQGTYNQASIATALLREVAPRPAVTPSPSPAASPSPSPSILPPPPSPLPVRATAKRSGPWSTT